MILDPTGINGGTFLYKFLASEFPEIELFNSVGPGWYRLPKQVLRLTVTEARTEYYRGEL